MDEVLGTHNTGDTSLAGVSLKIRVVFAGQRRFRDTGDISPGRSRQCREKRCHVLTCRGMAETLRVVNAASSPVQGSAPKKPRRRREIDPGIAVIAAAIIGLIGVIIGRGTAPNTSHALTAAPTVTVTMTVTASPLGRKSSGQASTAPTSPTPSSTSTTWLDQLHVIGSGEVSPDGSHELLIKPAENGNIVTYDISRKFKTLNLNIKPEVPTQPNEGTTFIEVILDGNNDQDQNFGPNDPESNWIISVAGVETLKLSIYGSTQDPNLLVSGALIS